MIAKIYGFRKLRIEITSGLWESAEKENGFYAHSVDGLLQEEAVKRVHEFYTKCGVDKYRAFNFLPISWSPLVSSYGKSNQSPPNNS